jgi:hypothetical protein
LNDIPTGQTAGKLLFFCLSPIVATGSKAREKSGWRKRRPNRRRKVRRLVPETMSSDTSHLMGIVFHAAFEPIKPRRTEY